MKFSEDSSVCVCVFFKLCFEFGLRCTDGAVRESINPIIHLIAIKENRCS